MNLASNTKDKFQSNRNIFNQLQRIYELDEKNYSKDSKDLLIRFLVKKLNLATNTKKDFRPGLKKTNKWEITIEIDLGLDQLNLLENIFSLTINQLCQ